MENLGSEITQLSSLVEMQMPYGRGPFHHPGVVVVHTVYIGPYLNLLDSESSSDKGCRVVGSSAEQIVHLSVQVAADKALGQIQIRAFEVLDYLCKPGLDVLAVGLTLGVGFHEIEGIQKGGLVSLLKQVIVHHMGRKELSLGYDELLLGLGEKAFCKALKILEHPVGISLGLALILFLGIQFAYMAAILGFETAYGIHSPFGVFIVQIVRYFDKRVGSPAHSRQYHEISSGSSD